jgi:hypothetical protein
MYYQYVCCAGYLLYMFCPSDTELFMLDPFRLLDDYVTFCGDATAVSEVVGSDLTPACTPIAEKSAEFLLENLDAISAPISFSSNESSPPNFMIPVR